MKVVARGRGVCPQTGPPESSHHPAHWLQPWHAAQSQGTGNWALPTTPSSRGAQAHLLQACDGHELVQALAAPLLHQVIEHLARAEDEPPHLPRSPRRSPILRNHPLETGSWGPTGHGWGVGPQRGQSSLGIKSTLLAPPGSPWPPSQAPDLDLQHEPPEPNNRTGDSGHPEMSRGQEWRQQLQPRAKPWEHQV